nr:ATP-binding protein [uncultured Albidiferax sp.]
MATSATSIAPFFQRHTLAARIALQVLTTDAGSASGSGLFLAAPRRTGKSTFVREDLRPQLEHSGALVLYVDLWADRSADPGAVIVGAVRAELGKHAGVLERLARSAGMDKVSVGGMAFSLDRVGLGADISLSGAFAALSDEVKKPIVLIIDEAQHAISTDSGARALFALKAARDELNSTRHHGLRIVATGSNRDKLAMLRAGRDQAFYGAPLVNFPHLDLQYVQWFCAGAQSIGTLDPAQVYQDFERAGYRPEVLGAALDTLRFDFELLPAAAPQRFHDAVSEQMAMSDEQTLRVIRALTPLQSAVLRVLVARGDQYAPFEAATIAAYQAVHDQLEGKSRVTTVEVPNVQQALAALQDKALVWRETRGVYALEESTIAELMERSGLLKPVPP